MRNVVLIFPSISRNKEDNEGNIRAPLGVLTLAGILLEKGYSVQVIDQRITPDWQEVLEKALHLEPICVGISSMSGDQIRFGLEIARFVRSRTDRPIVWGGVHPTLEPRTTLEHPLVDISVVGEGEESFPALLEALETNRPVCEINGIGYKVNGKPQFTPPARVVDLETIPPIPYELLDLSKYSRDYTHFGFKGRVVIPLETSRGCSHRCTFCTESKRPTAWRAVSAARVLADIKRVVERYGARSFTFNDDNFFVNRKRVNEIADLIIAEGLDIEWYANIRPDYLSAMKLPFLKKLEQAGARALTLGAESGSARILEMVQKGASVEQILRANKNLTKTNIAAHYVTIQGFPNETLEDLKATYEMVIQILKDNDKAHLALVKLIPTPATKIFDLCVEMGMKKPQGLEDWSNIYDFQLLKDSGWIAPEVNEWMLKNQYLQYVFSFKNKSYWLGNLVFFLFTSFYLWRTKNGWSGFDLDARLGQTIVKLRRRFRDIASY